MRENVAWTLLPKERSSSIRKVVTPCLHRSSREHMLKGNRDEQNKLGRTVCERLRAIHHWFEHVLGFRVVARDANEYAGLSRGETSLQLAADDAPYWKPERPRLLPPGQRGSGVEIVLLVEAVYRQAQQARADIVRPLADYPWHMQQFWVRHPDGYLIRPAQRILSVNPASYRRQVADAFRRDTPRIT